MSTPPSAIIPIDNNCTDNELQQKVNNLVLDEQKCDSCEADVFKKQGAIILSSQNLDQKLLTYYLPTHVDPEDIGIKILNEEDKDGYMNKFFVEEKMRNFNDYTGSQQIIASQDLPVVQIHFTYRIPLITMSPDLFVCSVINHMQFDVDWDINDADNKYLIGFCFIMESNNLLFLPKGKTKQIFTLSELSRLKEMLLGKPWSQVLGKYPVVEEDKNVIITSDRIQGFLDKRNGNIRRTALKNQVDLSSLINEYCQAATMYHVSKIDKERQINSLIQTGAAQIIDHTNLDGGWALVHQDCIGLPKWDIKPFPKQKEWSDIEAKYKELRTKLRVEQYQQLELKKYEDGTIMRQITPDHRYHVIFTGEHYKLNDDLSLYRNMAYEHVEFIRSVLSNPRLSIGIVNLEVTISRLYERLVYEKLSATDYYVQNPIVYGWHDQLFRTAKIHSQDIVSINYKLFDEHNILCQSDKVKNEINIHKTCQATAFIVWFN